MRRWRRLFLHLEPLEVAGRGRARGERAAEGDEGGESVTLQPSCVRAEEGEVTGIPGGAVGYGLKAVEGAAARGGSDGRDVVGGGCTPLSARATATNNHPWSIHGGFIRQVLLNPCVHLSSRCFPRFSPFFSLSLSFSFSKLRKFRHLLG